MTSTAEIIFWASLAGVAYAYAGYGLVAWFCARLWVKPRTAPELEDDALPTMTLFIPAHNEEMVIGQRLENALAIDYPPEKLTIVVASDGSGDRTAEIVRSFDERGVRLLDYPQNRGKAATTNAAMEHIETDVVMFSDANTWLEPDAARKLARWFALPDVGAVCGRLVLVDPATGKNTDSLYWRYETLLKRCEGRLGAILGGNGAIYAIRRTNFVPISPQTIIDDFVIPLLSRLRTGCRIEYDAEALAYEETPRHVADEFRRRARIGAGGFQSLGLLWPLFSPKWGWLAFSLFSHKLLRWLCPFFLLAMLVSNAALAGEPFYQMMLLGQVAFYLSAIVGPAVPGSGTAVRLLRLASLFASMNAALFVGFVRWATGRQRGTWARTPR